MYEHVQIILIVTISLPIIKVLFLVAYYVTFCLWFLKKIVEESDRRAHGKSQRHKNSKERKRRWSCEDCHEYFNDEGALMSHLSSNRHCKQVLYDTIIYTQPKS